MPSRRTTQRTSSAKKLYDVARREGGASRTCKPTSGPIGGDIRRKSKGEKQ